MYAKIKTFIIPCVVLIAICSIFFMLGSYYADNNRGAEDNANYARIIERIGRIDTQLDTIAKRIDTSQKRLEIISERIGRSEESIGEVVSRIDADKERLDRVKAGQREIATILETARKRTLEENK